MTCPAAQSLLDAHFDDELDATLQAQVREHLEGCSSCSAALAGMQRLREDMSASSLYYRAPASLRRKVTGSLEQKRETVWPWKWIAVAACIALVISLAGNFLPGKGGRTEDQLLAREVLSGHLRAMRDGHLVDVVSSDRHTVKPWFGGKLDFSPNVIDLAGKGFPLAGGRVDYLDGRDVAALVFHRAQHVINLYTWPGNRAGAAEVSQNGFQVVAWSKDGMAYWAVSDLNMAELKQFAGLYRE